MFGKLDGIGQVRPENFVLRLETYMKPGISLFGSTKSHVLDPNVDFLAVRLFAQAFSTENKIYWLQRINQ